MGCCAHDETGRPKTAAADAGESPRLERRCRLNPPRQRKPQPRDRTEDRLARPGLPAADLGGVAVFEFLCNRVLAPLSTAPIGAAPGSTLAIVISALSRYSQNLAAVLGIFVVAACCCQPCARAARPDSRWGG